MSVRVAKARLRAALRTVDGPRRVPAGAFDAIDASAQTSLHRER
jgi:hypothetical protein